MQLSGSGRFSADGVVVDDRDHEEDRDDGKHAALADEAAEGSEDDTDNCEVRVREGRSYEAQGAHDGIQARCQESNHNTVDERANDRALETAGRVAADTCCCAAEEVDDRAGKDHGCRDACGIHSNQDEEGQDTADERAGETDQNGVGSEVEHDRAVKSGDRVGDQLLGNALESGNDLVDDQTDTCQDYVNACGEGNGFYDGVYDPVLIAEELSRLSGRLDYSDSSDDKVADEHDQRDGDIVISQEGKTLGEVDIFRSRTFFAAVFSAEKLADLTCYPVSGGTEMAKGDRVITDRFPDDGLHEPGEEGHDKSEKEGAGDIKHDTLHACDLKDAGDQACHVQGMVTGQEDKFHIGKSRENDVGYHAQREDGRCFRGELVQSYGYDCFVIGDDTFHAESGLENVAEGNDRFLYQSGTCVQDDKAQDCHDGSLYNGLEI